MATLAGDAFEAPADVLRQVGAPDDAGAQTADRFDWQAMMATADALSAYCEALDDDGNLTNPHFSLICEHHEDWALIRDDISEIVSAKHREASVAPFSSLRSVLTDGGVLHLLDRWKALNQTPLCRLVTTGGLARDAARLASACEQVRSGQPDDDGTLTALVSDLTRVIADLRRGDDPLPAPETEETLITFLGSLRMQHGEPRRDHLPDMAIERYGRPVAQRLGRQDAAAAVWQAVLGLVRERMRAAGPTPTGGLPAVLGSAGDGALVSRTLTLQNIDTAVRFALAHIRGYTPLPRIIKANKMAVKMARGGCSDNAIERADDLRLQYRRYQRAIRSTPRVSDPQLQLTNTLSRVIDEVTTAVRVEDAAWGAALWRELGSRFQALEGRPEVQGLSVDLLLGGASEFANNCRAWYTDRFDVTAELRRQAGEVA